MFFFPMKFHYFTVLYFYNVYRLPVTIHTYMYTYASINTQIYTTENTYTFSIHIYVFFLIVLESKLFNILSSEITCGLVLCSLKITCKKTWFQKKKRYFMLTLPSTLVSKAKLYASENFLSSWCRKHRGSCMHRYALGEPEI